MMMLKTKNMKDDTRTVMKTMKNDTMNLYRRLGDAVASLRLHQTQLHQGSQTLGCNRHTLLRKPPDHLSRT